MNEQTRLLLAKEACLERLKDSLFDFEQVGDFSFASLEEVDGKEVWVVVNLIAKKKYDIDAAVEDYEFSKVGKKENKTEG